MSYRVPDSPDTLTDSNSTNSSFFSMSETRMDLTGDENTTKTPLDPNSSSSNLLMLPTNLWNLQYITHSSEILSSAIKINPELVSHLFASSQADQKLPSVSSPPVTLNPQPNFRISTPLITPYDGKPENLRPFCSQLVNQMKGCEQQFVTEMAKVRFAYQCLGPGALLKMRSSFRCLEDPSVPPEITTLTGFLDALRQRCQDPGLEEKATRAVEILYQKKTPFHDFITSFEDLMADSIYANQPKSQWKIMLRRRLSRKLQEALVMAHDVPTDYHPFVSYLRQKDAAFQEINCHRLKPCAT